jgi:hypothetical protein
VNDAIPLGPALTGTVVAKDLRATVRAYCDYLDARVYEDTVVSAAQATLWGKPKLAGTDIVTLSSASGYPWLRIISNPDVIPAKPFLELGWMALEVLVEDVDTLYLRLRESPFTIYRPPANREPSEDVRTLQVIGPAGEVLYLTQVKAKNPPFDLPRAQCAVDRLFIPVSSCLRRDAALKVYANLGASRSWSFDTSLVSVNKAHGLAEDLRHPVASVQLAGQCMVEIDQLGVATARPPAGGGFPAGIAMVSFLVDSIETIRMKPISPVCKPGGKLYANQPVVACRGSGGELIELIQAVA